MKTQLLPKTDSILELAEFWDNHDLMDFEDELEEVIEPAFEPARVISSDSRIDEAEVVRRVTEG
jgi:hypothetical protein